MDRNKPTIPNGALLGAGAIGLFLLLRKRPRPYIFDPPRVTLHPTITLEQARVIAEQVRAALYASSTFWTGPVFGDLTEDEAAVIAAMTNEVIQNDADVLLVVDAYGIYGELMTPDYTLPQAINAYLTSSDVQEINSAYADRGISIRF